MQSKVHPTYKTKYRVANWAAYDHALVRRGDVTLWLSSKAIAAWMPRRRKVRVRATTHAACGWRIANRPHDTGRYHVL